MKLLFQKNKKEFVEPEKFKIKYINEMSDLINIIPEKLIVNKIDNTQNEEQHNQNDCLSSEKIIQNNLNNQNNQKFINCESK